MKDDPPVSRARAPGGHDTVTVGQSEHKRIRAISRQLPRRIRRALRRRTRRPVDASPLLSEHQALLIARSLACLPEDSFSFGMFLWPERVQSAAEVSGWSPETAGRLPHADRGNRGEMDEDRGR